MTYKNTSSFIIITVLIAALAGLGGYLGGRRQQQPATSASNQTAAQRPPDKEEPGKDDGHGHETKGADSAHALEATKYPDHKEEGAEQAGYAGEGHGKDDGHGAEVSDLDRPIDEMWAARCEHDIPQYQCDECRYEIGMVKLDAGLFTGNGPVRAGFPERRQGRHEERSLPAEVQLDESRTVHVASPLTGLITRGFTTPGAKLEAGAPLFEVDSPEVADAKSAYLKARSSLEFAKKAATREALLFSKKIAAEVDVQAAEAKRAEAETDVAASRGRLLRLGLTAAELDGLTAKNGTSALNGLVVVRASRAGSVIEGHAAPGEHAETGKELLTISGLEQVWVMADLKDNDLSAISSAAGGEAKIDALGRSFTGRLDTIAGRMSEETRTVKARFIVDNPEGLLKPGMFVSVRLLMPVAGESIAVPKVSVLADEGRTFVFTHKEGDFWVRRPVTLGARFGDMVEIVSGLTADQRIITDGSFLLKSDVLRGKMGAGCAD